MIRYNDINLSFSVFITHTFNPGYVGSYNRLAVRNALAIKNLIFNLFSKTKSQYLNDVKLIAPNYGQAKMPFEVHHFLMMFHFHI